MTDNKPDNVMSLQREAAVATSTPQQMMSLLEVQALSLSMNNAASAQQNAYTLNTAIVSSICSRILAAGNSKAQTGKK
jgi:hypothetical protein